MWVEASVSDFPTANFSSNAQAGSFGNEDGKIEIHIDEKALLATADFFPPVGNGRPLDNDYISAIIERANIQYGLDWERVQTHAMEANLNQKVIKGIIIAQGDGPVEEIEEYYEMNPAFRVWPKLPDGDVPRVDWREVSPFIIVKKGQKLAIRRPKVYGNNGKTIHGDLIEMSIKKPESVLGGTNTNTDEKAIYAACDGRLVEEKLTLSVEEVLAIKGGIDYKTGHIAFPGDIILDGPVADGFRLYSGGSILAKQTLDASDVVSKKDLVVAGGLVGRLGGYVRSGNEVRCKFIQNCRLAARGSVIVGGGIINSHIYSMDKVDCGEKGKIIASEVWAINGVKALNIGSEKGKQTKIHCGIDFTVQQELERVNERIKIVSLKLQKLREKIAQDASSSMLKKMKDLELVLLGDLEKSNTRVGELLAKLDSNDEAKIEVLGTATRGSLIEICHVALWLEEDVSKSCFVLEKALGKISIEKL